MLNSTDADFVKKTLPFWGNLCEKEKSLILENTQTVSYRPGESIYNGSYQCVGVLIVMSGELRTYILSEDGREVTLYRLNTGELCVLSASCLLKGITFDVHISSEQNSRALLIDIGVFQQILEKNIYVENFSLKVAIDKFSEVMWAMEQILFMSFDRRLAIFLVDESAKTKSDTLSLTHEQIAKYIGSAREVVSRCLKYFAKEGLIEAYRGEVKIIDKARLKSLT